MATIQLRAQCSVSELKRALKESVDADQKTRIRAIINIKEGATKTATAKRFVVSRTSVISWVAAYNEGGIDALAMSKGGRPEGNPVWDASVFNDLGKEIDKGGYWSIPRMQAWIKKHHQKEIPEQTVWYRMDQLNYSYKSARPSPIGGSKEKRETFKKRDLPRSWSR
jgi:transposase